MPRQNTEYACPTCRDAGAKSQIVADEGKIVCSVNPSHVWRDIPSFKELKPTMEFKVVTAQFAPQTNRTVMQVEVPTGVKEKLETKFAGKLGATVAGILQMMSEGETLLIPQSDLERMKQRFGKKPESAGELFGLIFSMGMDKDTADLEANNAKAKLEAFMAKHEGYVALDLGEQYVKAVARAADANEPVDAWAERNLKNAIESDWF